MQCTAKSKSTGKQCARSAIAFGNVCRVHGGAAPQTKAAAMMRAMQHVDPIMAEVVRIALHGKSEAVRLQAAKEVFERLGLGDPKRIEITQIPDPAVIQDWIAAIERDLTGDN